MGLRRMKLGLKGMKWGIRGLGRRLLVQRIGLGPDNRTI